MQSGHPSTHLLTEWRQPPDSFHLRNRISTAFVISVLAAGFTYGARHWDRQTILGLFVLALISFSPAMLVYMLKGWERKSILNRAGELLGQIAQADAQRLPWRVKVTLLLSACAFPFAIFLFRNAELLIQCLTVFAACVVFMTAHLRFDSLPLELRREGLVVDGLNFIAWNDIHSVSRDRMRANLVTLECAGREARLFVAPSQSQAFVAWLDQMIE